ncbi:MAG: hypothetical protein NT138_06190 [Planctomycetales bacterium]|nr:hypothetical protein [Planctomycetales bacterium]
MSGTPYIDGATLDEAAEAIRQGKKLEALAGILKCSPEHLARLLNLPAKSSANMVAEPSVDLWAVEKLEGQL